MRRILTPTRMAAIEKLAVDVGAVDWATLMERAGAGVVDAVMARWPCLSYQPGEAVILCGPGGNGGDGYVVARLLHDRGWSVRVVALAQSSRTSPQAQTMRRAWMRLGPVETFTPEFCAPTQRHPALLVDALFGGGLTRRLDDRQAAAVRRLQQGRTCCAIDAPSGLSLASGAPLGAPAPADLTVTFEASKIGHHVGAGPSLCGELRVVDIGLKEAMRHAPSDEPDGIMIERPQISARAITAHKYDHGHVIVPAGGPGQGGAARLSAAAALRSGAGLVTVAPPDDAMVETAAQSTAVMVAACDGARDLEALLRRSRSVALVLGPGLGMDARAEDLLAAAADAGVARVLDADALTLLAAASDAHRAALTAGPTVLTPHFGEFKRLATALGVSVEACAKVETARAMATKLDAVLVLKGPDTLVASPDGAFAVHAAFGRRAAPWLATAGSGDVLAGAVAARLAAGAEPFDAACAAVWLHAEAGRRAGPGLTAADLPRALAEVLADA